MAKKNEATIWQDIRPKEKSYDDWETLGFGDAKNKFLNVLTNIKPPLTVGLYGAWGSGKTRMIEGLKDDIKNQGNLVLIFDAWKYRHERNLVLPLICALEREYLLKTGRIKESAKKVVTSAAIIMANQFLKNKIGIDIGEVKATLETYDDGYKHYKKYDDNVSKIEEEYKKFVKIIMEGKEKLIIFIDNLDRCLPDIVVNLLEDISSFLSIPNVPCIYVLAMDKENVIKAITHKYPDFDGVHYLEKIVQVAFCMPKLTEKGELKWFEHFIIRYCQAKMSKDTCIFGHTNDLVLTELDKLKELFSPGGLLNNPRRIQRFVNKCLVLEAMDIVKSSSSPSVLPMYFFCILLKEHFPKVFYGLEAEKDYSYLLQLISRSQLKKNGSPHELAMEHKKNDSMYIPNKTIFDAYCGDNGSLSGFFKCFKELPTNPDCITAMPNVKSEISLID